MKLLYTVFPCLLLALTCDMGLVARSQEQDMAAVQEEEQTSEQDISYTAGVAQINDEIEREEEAGQISLAAGEAAIAQDIIDRMQQNWRAMHRSSASPGGRGCQ